MYPTLSAFFEEGLTLIGAAAVTVGSILTLSKGFGWVKNSFKRVWRKQDKDKEREKEFKRFMEEQKRENEEIKRSLAKIMENLKLNNEGTKDTLKALILSIVHEARHRGSITELEKLQLTDLYSSYSALDGDSYVTSEVKSAMKMKVSEENY